MTGAASWRGRAASRSTLWQRQNAPPQGEGQNWIWMTREMLESPAWRALSRAASMVISRIAIEHMNHGGGENGRLVVTYDDFAAFGVRRQSVCEAVAEAEALGWIEVTHRGRGGNADFRKASTYALGWLPQAPRDDAPGGELARNRWREIESDEDAERALREAKARAGRSMRKAAPLPEI